MKTASRRIWRATRPAPRRLWLDKELEGRQCICGDRFTLADILLFAFMAFGAEVGQPIPDEAKWVKAWFERVKARPSAAA